MARNDSRLMHMLATRRRARVHAGALFLLLLLLPLQASGFDWTVDVTPAGEVFPVLDLTQQPHARDGTLGTGSGLIAVRLEGTLPQVLELQIETPGLRVPGRMQWRNEAAAPARRLDLRPHLQWDITQLREISGTRRQTLRVTLVADGATRVREVQIRVHALDDAPYFVREAGARVDLAWAFAGYVDPHDPIVDQILALAREIDPGFDAAPRADQPGLVLRRVAAIWAALERRGMRYDAGDPTLSRGPVVWSQRVRLPDEVWRERRANCIDGSVLIASVFERLGLGALIVLVPGHAFVGYRNHDGNSEFLETTVLGAGKAGRGGTFAAARTAGRKSWRRAAKWLDGRHGPDYALIDIERARRVGIVPLSAGSAQLRDAVASRGISGSLD